MENTTYKYYLKYFIKETIDFLSNTETIISNSKNQTINNQDIISMIAFKDKFDNFIQEKEFLQQFNRDDILDVTLFLNIFNLTFFKNSSKEIENYFFELLHYSKKITNFSSFQRQLILFNIFMIKLLNNTFKNEINHTNIRNYFPNFLNDDFKNFENDEHIKITEDIFENDKMKGFHFLNLLEKIFDLFTSLGFKNEFLNKTCTQFLKHFITFMTSKQKFLFLTTYSLTPDSEINLVVKKYNPLFLSFIFYNCYLDNAFGIIDFIIDFMNLMYINKLEKSIKNSVNVNSSIIENKENYNSEFLIEFTQKENLYKIFNIKNFENVNFSSSCNLSLHDIVIQRDICLFYFINSYKALYIQLREKYFLNPENNIFCKLKTIEIYQESQEALFFIPTIFNYIKFNLQNDKNFRSSYIMKIESEIANKISKISRLDSQFSYIMLNFDTNKFNKNYMRNRNNKLLDNTYYSKFKHKSCSLNRIENYFQNYHSFGFSAELKKNLTANFKFLINNYFSLIVNSDLNKTINIRSNYSTFLEMNSLYVKEGKYILDYKTWMEYYLENPYLTYLISYRYFYDFFINEKIDYEDEEEIDSEKLEQIKQSNLLELFYNYSSITKQSNDIVNYYDIYDFEKILLRMTEKIKDQNLLIEYLR